MNTRDHDTIEIPPYEHELFFKNASEHEIKAQHLPFESAKVELEAAANLYFQACMKGSFKAYDKLLHAYKQQTFQASQHETYFNHALTYWMAQYYPYLDLCYHEINQNRANAARMLFRENKQIVEQYDYATAALNLAFCYRFGIGVVADESKEFSWLLFAAKKGHAIAQNNLGHSYGNGKGTTQDPNAAFEWYLKAATQGQPIAIMNIGYCFLHGFGTKQDLYEANKWHQKALDIYNNNPEKYRHEEHVNIHHNLSVIYYKMDNMEMGNAFYKKLKSLFHMPLSTESVRFIEANRNIYHLLQKSVSLTQHTILGSTNDSVYSAICPTSHHMHYRVFRPPISEERYYYKKSDNNNWKLTIGDANNKNTGYLFYTQASKYFLDFSKRKLTFDETYHLRLVAIAQQTRHGNCHIIANLIAHYILSQPLSLPIRINILNLNEIDHVILAVQLNDKKEVLDMNDLSTWNCFIVDFWKPGNLSGVYIYHSSELVSRLKKMLPFVTITDKKAIDSGKFTAKVIHGVSSNEYTYGHLASCIEAIPPEIDPQNLSMDRAAQSNKMEKVFIELHQILNKRNNEHLLPKNIEVRDQEFKEDAFFCAQQHLHLKNIKVDHSLSAVSGAKTKQEAHEIDDLTTKLVSKIVKLSSFQRAPLSSKLTFRFSQTGICETYTPSPDGKTRDEKGNVAGGKIFHFWANEKTDLHHALSHPENIIITSTQSLDSLILLKS